mgnify:CR=1 FL=1
MVLVSQRGQTFQKYTHMSKNDASVASGMSNVHMHLIGSRKSVLEMAFPWREHLMLCVV